MRPGLPQVSMSVSSKPATKGTRSSGAIGAEAEAEAEAEREADLESLTDVASETSDGVTISLMVNTGLQTDVVRSQNKGADGVGLFRTEVPFMMRDRFPSEDEQAKIYRAQLEAFAPLPVTMRMLDVGGDKALPYFPVSEKNPFLGWRGLPSN